jgi:hypothetical protein
LIRPNCLDLGCNLLAWLFAIQLHVLAHQQVPPPRHDPSYNTRCLWHGACFVSTVVARGDVEVVCEK